MIERIAEGVGAVICAIPAWCLILLVLGKLIG